MHQTNHQNLSFPTQKSRGGRAIFWVVVLMGEEPLLQWAIYEGGKNAGRNFKGGEKSEMTPLLECI